MTTVADIQLTMKRLTSTVQVFGPRVVTDKNLVETIRMPRLPSSKSRRIRRKWIKRYPQFKTVPSEKCYRLDLGAFSGTPDPVIVMHPVTLEKMTEAIRMRAEHKIDDEILKALS